LFTRQVEIDKEVVRQILETNLNVKKGCASKNGPVAVRQGQKLARKEVFYQIVDKIEEL
jgi:hypothetical protein